MPTQTSTELPKRKHKGFWWPSFFNIFSKEKAFDWISPMLDAESFRCGHTAIERQKRAVKTWAPIIRARRSAEEVKQETEERKQAKEYKKARAQLKAAGLIDRDPDRFYPGDFVVVDCPIGSPHFHLYGHLGVIQGPNSWGLPKPIRLVKTYDTDCAPNRYMVKVRKDNTIFFSDIWAYELTLVLKVSVEFSIT